MMPTRPGWLAVVFLVLALAPGARGASTSTGVSEEMRSAPVVLGYYPSWESGLPPGEIRFERFTHLSHAFVTCNASGELERGGNLPSRALTDRAHAAGVKVLISLGGMDSDARFGPAMSSPEAARRFAEATARLVAEHGYDGVDIDWEFPSDEAGREGLTRMATLLREALDRERPGALLTAAFSGAAWTTRFVDAEALRPLLDWVAVMTYDVHGPWSDHAGPNAPLVAAPGDRPQCRDHSVTGQMAHWRDRLGWPRERLLVGIPCYGRGFVAQAWYESTQGAPRPPHPYIAFRDVAGLLAQGWVRTWDAATQTPWLAREGGEEIISYDDEESARLKGRWAAEHGFRGIFFWEISQDFVAGDHALVRAACEGWRSATGSETPIGGPP